MRNPISATLIKAKLKTPKEQFALLTSEQLEALLIQAIRNEVGILSMVVYLTEGIKELGLRRLARSCS